MTSTRWPKIKIHYTFLLIIIVNLLMNNFLELTLLLIALFLHEIGHILMIYLRRGKVFLIQFNAFGGIIKTDLQNSLLVDSGRHLNKLYSSYFVM